MVEVSEDLELEAPEILVFFPHFLRVSGSEELEIVREGCEELFWNKKGKSFVGLGGGMSGDIGEGRGFELGAVGGRVSVMSISPNQLSIGGVLVGFTPFMGP